MAHIVQPRQSPEYSSKILLIETSARLSPHWRRFSKPPGSLPRQAVSPLSLGAGTGFAFTWPRPPQHMAYVHRHVARKRSRFSAESVYLLVVVAAFVATAVWGGRVIGVNLSAISTVVAVLGINERMGTTRHVGYTATTPSPTALPPSMAVSGQGPG